MNVFKKIVNKIDSAVMSPRLQRMLPGSLETAKRIANASTHSAKRYSRLLASEVAESAIRGMGPGALIGAGYGLVSDEESVIGGALKGAMTGAALAGGYATYRARAMLSSAGARSVGGVSPKAIKRSVAKRRADKTSGYIVLSPSPREAAEQATKQAAKASTATATGGAASTAPTDVRVERFKERARIGELLKPYRDPETGRLSEGYFDELRRMYNGIIPQSVVEAHEEVGIFIPRKDTLAGALDRYNEMRSTFEEF